MTNGNNYILWNMTRKCNFRCKYCYFPHDSSPVDSSLAVDKILEFLDSTEKEWTIGMTGGEPFIYPDFVGLCRSMTKKHKIEIDSNLSITPRVRDFAESIDPARVIDIYAALHIEERERTKGVEQFIETVLLLKEKNFHVSINYVIHPTLVDRYKADFEYFQSRGIKLLPRPFKGIFEGRGYPISYSPDEKALFASKPKAGTKIVYNFKGVPCDAGKRLIRLEPDGSVTDREGDIYELFAEGENQAHRKRAEWLHKHCALPAYNLNRPIEQDSNYLR
ncbi:radical SAM protein [Thermodesulfobacteriota bacterium]